MRIFNATDSTMSLPFSSTERITISAKSPSKELMCSSEFLSLLITTYTNKQIAVIVSGPFEISAITNIPTIVDYVVQSLDEAITRFNVISKEETTEEKLEKASEATDDKCCDCAGDCECDKNEESCTCDSESETKGKCCKKKSSKE